MNPANTRIEIQITEVQSQPPSILYADEDNPTPAELEQSKQEFQEWLADGGFDRHQLRARLTAGPTRAGGVWDLNTTKHKAMVSPLFHKDDDAARKRAESCLRDMVSAGLSHYVFTEL
jgi:hypothetical protein